MTIKDKLMIYVYHKGNEIDEELETYKAYARYRTPDGLEHYEYMRAMIRLETWKEILNDLYKLIINCR